MNLMESRRIQDQLISFRGDPVRQVSEFLKILKFLEIQNVSPPLSEKTVQTSLFAFPGGSGLGIINRSIINIRSFFPGNKLFELIALRGIADTLQRTPIINVVKGEYVEALLNRIQPIFPLLLGQYQLRIVPVRLQTTNVC